MIRLLMPALVFCLLAVTSCKNALTPPELQPKDPNRYTWTIDTLSFQTSPNGFEQVIMMDIWGLNDTLVYAVGHDANILGTMWKYDGKKWERVHLMRSEGGPIDKLIELYGVRGFAANDLYAFGIHSSNYTGHFLPFTVGIHFDGTQWHEIPMPKGQGIKSVVAVSPSNIYCGGWYDGQIYHYNGSQWSADTIKARHHPELYIDVSLMGISPNTQDLYFQTEQLQNIAGGFYYTEIIQKGYNQSAMLDSAYNDVPWGGDSFWQSKEGTMYSCGVGGVFRLVNGKWTTSLSSSRIFSIFGTSDQHIFAVGTSGIYFYDRISWRIISLYNGTTGSVHVWCSETEVFIVYTDGRKTYVLHGK
ncbi:MAG TPA: hypothetical protein VK470_11805 [Bacteroidota bacterium]|nr:hypothetical protein [Bacteroidota bacterium]